MKTPSLAALAFLALLLDPANAIPLTHQKLPSTNTKPRSLPRQVVERGLVGRQEYGFGTPEEFAASGQPEERPNICGSADCTPDLKKMRRREVKVRELTTREKRIRRALMKRAEDAGFITEIKFRPE
jgi:hypothetical protein